MFKKGTQPVDLPNYQQQLSFVVNKQIYCLLIRIIKLLNVNLPYTNGWSGKKDNFKPKTKPNS